MPRREVAADFHCVTRFTVPCVGWQGVPAAEVLRVVPPDPAVTHVMVWADFGYGANMRIGFAADDTLLATHRDGRPLTPRHGSRPRTSQPRGRSEAAVGYSTRPTLMVMVVPAGDGAVGE
jgi:DMSO/TMAO reductase YedYZ molybdopterin-dependent catalytic subunit